MAKSKHAPALFEVIQAQEHRKGGPGKLAVPKWWKDDQGDSPAGVEETRAEPLTRPEPEAREAAEPGELEAGSPVVAFGELGPPGGPAEGAPERPRLLGVRGGRVVVSLNPVNTAVVVGVLLLALLCSYQLGARFGASSPAVPQGDVGERGGANDSEGSARPDVLNVGPAGSGRDRAAGTGKPGSGEAAAGAGPTTPSASGNQAGRLHYVVLQIFARDHKPAAEHAQKVLQSEYGIAAVLEARGSKWQLISEDRFDFGREDQKQRAYRYGGRIKALGEALGKGLAAAGLPVYQFGDPYVELEK